MSILDTDILTEVQGLLAETENSGASWSSGMWTPDEVVGYLNDRQQGIIADTGLVLTRTTIACVPYLLRQALPGDWIATARLVWVRAADLRHFVLDRGDLWELDSTLQDWRTVPGIPQVYTDADTPTLEVQIVPAPDTAGFLKLTYLALPAAFTGGGVGVTVPEESTPGLVWGTLGRMLRKEGRAKDPARADIADARYQLVVEAVKLLLQGWEA